MGLSSLCLVIGCKKAVLLVLLLLDLLLLLLWWALINHNEIVFVNIIIDIIVFVCKLMHNVVQKLIGVLLLLCCSTSLAILLLRIRIICLLIAIVIDIIELLSIDVIIIYRSVIVVVILNHNVRSRLLVSKERWRTWGTKNSIVCEEVVEVVGDAVLVAWRHNVIHHRLYLFLRDVILLADLLLFLRLQVFFLVQEVEGEEGALALKLLYFLGSFLVLDLHGVSLRQNFDLLPVLGNVFRGTGT